MDPTDPTTIPGRAPALLMVLAGPAGSGKTTLCERLVTEREGVQRVVTATTRSPRPGEIHETDYFFFSDTEFDELVEARAFLEWARVHGADRRYGTLRKPIESKLAAGRDLVMNVDVQGVASIQQAAQSDAALARSLVTVFVMPPSLDELRERLRGRAQDDEAEIERRMETARREMRVWERFDFVITSRTREADFAVLQSIFGAEKHRVKRMGTG